MLTNANNNLILIFYFQKKEINENNESIDNTYKAR